MLQGEGEAGAGLADEARGRGWRDLSRSLEGEGEAGAGLAEARGRGWLVRHGGGAGGTEAGLLQWGGVGAGLAGEARRLEGPKKGWGLLAARFLRGEGVVGAGLVGSGWRGWDQRPEGVGGQGRMGGWDRVADGGAGGSDWPGWEGPVGAERPCGLLSCETWCGPLHRTRT